MLTGHQRVAPAPPVHDGSILSLLPFLQGQAYRRTAWYAINIILAWEK